MQFVNPHGGLENSQAVSFDREKNKRKTTLVPPRTDPACKYKYVQVRPHSFHTTSHSSIPTVVPRALPPMQTLPISLTACANWTLSAPTCTGEGSSQCAGCKLVVVSLRRVVRLRMLTCPSTVVQCVRRRTGRSTRRAANHPWARPVGFRLGIAKDGSHRGPLEMPLSNYTILSGRTSTCGAMFRPLIFCSWERTRASTTKIPFLCCSPVGFKRSESWAVLTHSSFGRSQKCSQDYRKHPRQVQTTCPRHHKRQRLFCRLPKRHTPALRIHFA